MDPQETDTVVAELAEVYRVASARAAEALKRSRDPLLPLMERASYRRLACQHQELADQALRMVRELRSGAAA